MVKKELVNKKVVRAIALGISAVMLTTPMTALANPGEGTPVDSDADTTDSKTDVKEDGQYATAENAIEDAQLSMDSAIKAAGAQILKEENDPEADEVIDNPYDEVKALEETANDELVSAETGLYTTEVYETKAATDVKEFNEIKAEIDVKNDEVKLAGEEAAKAVEKAAEAVVEAEAATTEAEAQAAADKAAEAVVEAEKAQEKAQASYDENLDKLQAAYDELESARKNLDEAEKALGGVNGDVEEALAAVEAAEEKAAALQAEVDEEAKVLNASKEATLKAAYDLMIAEANNSIRRVYTDTDKDGDNDGISGEWTAEFDNESASGAYWTAARDYFMLYIQYVYGESFKEGTFVKKNTLENGWDYKASRDNTYFVKYIDADGNPQEAYYNYHTADKSGNIYIYEKKIETGWTEEETEVVEVEKTRPTTIIEIQQFEEEVTTYKDELSIGKTDDSGNTTYTKLSEVQKDTDVVLTTESDEKGNATSVLVKDDASQLLDSNEAQLAKNQEIVEGSSTDTYTVSTIQVPVSYGTKEVKEDWEDCISFIDDLKDTYDDMKSQYSEEDGYVVRIYIHHLDGEMEELNSLEEAKKYKREALANGWLDRGYEVGVYKVVEDTETVTQWGEQKVIVKTTTADVITTTMKNMTATGNAGDRDRAEAEAREKAKELGLKEGEYTVSYETYHDKWLDWDCEYTIHYKVPEYSTSSQEVKTEIYSATEYTMNTIATTTKQMVDREVEVPGTEKYWEKVTRVVKESEEYKYWTECKNTTNDVLVKDAIDKITEKLDEMAAKQKAAKAAWVAADEAKKDVEDAKKALENLKVGTAAYDAAVKAYDEAKTAFAAAEKTLAEINEDVKEAQQSYADAAAELGRFVPTPSIPPTGGEGGTTGGGAGTTGGTTTTTTTVPVAETLVADAGVAPTTVATTAGAGAGQAVVEIEDEDTPLAAGIDNGDADANGGDDEVIVAGAEDDAEQAIVAIEDEETPLAAGAGADAKMSWWWLLIVALLGATGYKMYKDHQKKKEEAQEA